MTLPEWRRALVGLAVAVLCGCSGAAKTYPGPPQAILGTGILYFAPMIDCARVPIIHGIQGGYHIWGSVRARNLDFSHAQATFTVKELSGNLVPYPPGLPNPIVVGAHEYFTLTPIAPDAGAAGAEPDAAAALCPDGGVAIGGNDAETIPPDDGQGTWGESIGLRIFMPFSGQSRGDGGSVMLPTPDVDGRQLRIELQITDADGRTATDVHTPVPFYIN